MSTCTTATAEPQIIKSGLDLNDWVARNPVPACPSCGSSWWVIGNVFSCNDASSPRSQELDCDSCGTTILTWTQHVIEPGKLFTQYDDADWKSYHAWAADSLAEDADRYEKQGERPDVIARWRAAVEQFKQSAR